MLKFKKDNNAGLYLTISFHLIVLIIFLSYSINSVIQEESSFLLDFSKQEQIEEEIAEQEMKESVSRELDELIAQANSPRNVIVDANSPLRDDRNSNPSRLYQEAEDLQRKLDANKLETEKYLNNNEEAVPVYKETPIEESSYKGPSVISYRLDNRKAVSLPIPAYKCVGGGDVTVSIIVNQRGYVKTAKILEPVSSPDKCLQEYALKAAKRSRFTSSSTAPDRQAGDIVYRFIAQ